LINSLTSGRTCHAGPRAPSPIVTSLITYYYSAYYIIDVSEIWVYFHNQTEQKVEKMWKC